MVAPLAAGIGGAVVGGALGITGGILSERSARRARRRQRRAIQQAREFANQTVERITQGELFQGANQFLTQTFDLDNGQNSPLAQDFARGIRAAQSVRGTFTGNIGAAQEAIGVSAALQRQRQSLLPQALEFSFAPERLRQQILEQDARLRVASATGAQIFGTANLPSVIGSAIGQGISGAAGGFQIGSAFAGPSVTPAPEAGVASEAQFQSTLNAANVVDPNLSPAERQFAITEQIINSFQQGSRL